MFFVRNQFIFHFFIPFIFSFISFQFFFLTLLLLLVFKEEPMLKHSDAVEEEIGLHLKNDISGEEGSDVFDADRVLIALEEKLPKLAVGLHK